MGSDVDRAFVNRAAAGRALGQKLAAYEDWADWPDWTAKPKPIVLGLPRGGVPVAFEVAKILNLPLDICLVRKLGVPGQKELAMGAIASGGVRILNPDILKEMAIPNGILEEVVAREQQELQRRERAYRGDRPQPDLHNRTVILVDDGVATGATLRAAIVAVKQRGAAPIIAAVPVAERSVYARLQLEVAAVISLLLPERLHAVGDWYEDFSQTRDAEVRQLLAAARTCPPDSGGNPTHFLSRYFQKEVG